jgi:hypothetical protein
VQADEPPFAFRQAVPPGDERQVQGIPEAGAGAAEGPPNRPGADAEEAGEFPLAGPAEMDETQEVPLPERDEVEEPAEQRFADAEAAEFAVRQTREGQNVSVVRFLGRHVRFQAKSSAILAPSAFAVNRTSGINSEISELPTRRTPKSP